MTLGVRTIYMEDSRHYHKATITKIGAGLINKKQYQWVQLNETIFHPKGGGQPSDEGSIGGVKVAHVHKEVADKTEIHKFEIFHCFEQELFLDYKVGDEVELHIDPQIRSLHSRLHSGGHLLADAINYCFPELEAYQGNHYPDNSYVKFRINDPMTVEDKAEMKMRAEALIDTWIDQDREVAIMQDISGIRKVRVFERWTPCGGTHVASLKEVGIMEISDLSINKKEGTVTIKYRISSL